MLMGSLTRGPRDHTDFAIRADCRFGLRRKESIFFVDRQKAKLLCHSRLNVGRALHNASARRDGSEAGHLKVEAHAGVMPPSNETRGPFSEAPSFGENYESAMSWEAARASDDVMPVSEQGVEGEYAAQQIGRNKQGTDGTEEAGSRKQPLEKGSSQQAGESLNDVPPQRSLEEAFGLLKEQVEADKRVQLANKHGTEEVKSITDIPKPLKRSKIIAKQVISQSSARSIGFVSQLWVSERLSKVVALEVRPSLLSGEIDRVFLADVCQIGDVVLVNDESALENEMTALDCETLVGYDVITEDGNYVGKIRDYSFDLLDGNLTSLDFDSVGFSLLPSSLISTYRLDVDEVIEVLPDSIIVKSGAESRIKRLSKGLWQLPVAGERRRSQKMARSRMLKKNPPKDEDILAQSRQLPPSMRPRFLEEAEFEGLDARAEPGVRRSLPRDYGDSPPRYRSR